MNQGDEKKPFQKESDGVIRTPGNEFQQSRPPLPAQSAAEAAQSFYAEEALRDKVATQPIPIIPDGRPREANAMAPALSETKSVSVVREERYFFRYHPLRDPLERLFVRRLGPQWYAPFVYTSIALIVAPIIFMVVTLRVDLGISWVSILIGIFLGWYPVGREVFRHIKRTVTLVRTPKGILVIYGQPKNIFWGFPGDGNGDESFLEGSTEIRMHIGWLNRLIFWRCGNLTIFGKVEGGRIDFRNVPHVEALQKFLSNKA